MCSDLPNPSLRLGVILFYFIFKGFPLNKKEKEIHIEHFYHPHKMYIHTFLLLERLFNIHLFDWIRFSPPPPRKKKGLQNQKKKTIILVCVPHRRLFKPNSRKLLGKFFNFVA